MLTGESLDTIADLHATRRLLQRTKGLRKVPDVSTSISLGRESAGKLVDRYMLPTDVTARRRVGKQAAAPYKVGKKWVYK